MVPKPRKPGQSGGKYGQNKNSSLSRQRGGSPGAKKKSWSPCLVLILGGTLISGGLGGLAYHFWA